MTPALMPNIRINHPTDRPNFSVVTIGDLSVWFSYETPVAFRSGLDPIVVRENDWGPTTGKHINLVHVDHSARIPGDEFIVRLNDVINTSRFVVA